MSLTSPDLVAPFSLVYTYKRSTGPVIGRFLAGLRDKQILGVLTLAGDVLVPPTEYEPTTGESVTDSFVEVGPGGVITTWSWVDQPLATDPSQEPFAWAMIHLDGAATPLLHIVCSPAESIRTGARVSAVWADERVGSIRDLACFEVVS